MSRAPAVVERSTNSATADSLDIVVFVGKAWSKNMVFIVTSTNKCGASMKRLFLALFFFFSGSAFAQPLNPLWHGQWKGEGDPIVITEAEVEGCRWVGQRPSDSFSGCVSYYADSVDKADLVQLTENEKQLLQQGMSAGFITPDIVPQIKSGMQRNETLLAAIGDGRYRTLMTEDGDIEGSGDCVSYLILDKETIYRISHCEGPAEPSLNISPYRR